MINIIRKDDKTFQVSVNNVRTEDLTVRDLIKVLRAVDVRINEIEFAIEDLVKRNTTTAYFGVYRTFMFSK
jgi:hypothetical protein